MMSEMITLQVKEKVVHGGKTGPRWASCAVVIISK
jgi:hypothetical protein